MVKALKKVSLALGDTEGIGSTDARIIMTGDWHDLYMQKTGQAKRPDLSQEWKPRLGLLTEPLHAWWHAKETGDDVKDPVFNTEEFSRVRVAGKPDHHLVSIDRIVNDKELLEMKHTHAGNSLYDAGQYYMAQLQWQLYMTDTKRLRFSIIKGNEPPEWGYVERDEAYIEKLIATVDAFWWHVTEGQPPEDQINDEIRSSGKAAAATIPVAGQRKYDMTGDNEWSAAADRFILDKIAAESLKESEKAIKALVPKDALEITGAGVTFKRDKAGRLRLSIADDERAYAEKKLAALLEVQSDE